MLIQTYVYNLNLGVDYENCGTVLLLNTLYFDSMTGR